ncbi:MAG: IS1595 family transposase [Henriciella sp.]|jgi:transposase-like protein|uniref:IS1595 family transposase n=1 Tax=uncultured Henriciella sp. TaxID=1608424 RepID=UPI000C5993D4|nr:IS1595 family transposase [Henriciella sp.]MBF33002.1 IS1595 family transposase [Hyphomonadaceae bacterium]|tara:strand:- start:1161 stop:2117 length:957 start_codon:yes stop_codon:yes gene_type:complete
MAQHFLLSPAAKTLSLAKVLRMSDEDAKSSFRALRWASTDGEPVCPKCGCLDHSDLKRPDYWQCKGCKYQFSMTSGTIFHSRKLSVRDILGAIAIFTNGAKGYSALQLSRDLCITYKAAFVLCHKMREAIGAARDEGALSGNVEVDGAYFGGYVKPANRREDRKDRRRKVHQSGKRQVVIAMRETKGRTLTGVVSNEAEGVALTRANVQAGATVHADEAAHWDKLAAHFPIKRINHQKAYSQDGANTNAAESFFSRIRRAEIGTHHHVAGKYLAAYATEMAWREDARRTANGSQFAMIVSAAAVAPKSDAWCGYWQKR